MAQRVLVADDDPDVRKLLETALTREGYVVTLCSDGEAALSASTEREHDLLILDLMMQGHTGLEVVRALRDAGCQSPVVLMTASLHDQLFRALSFLEGVECLPKPFGLEELRSAIESAVRATGGR